MNIDKRWFLLLAAAACTVIGAAVASTSRRPRRRIAHDLHDATSAHKSWENEGGNLAPTPVAPVLP
jgi:hypothetical protein